MPHQCKCKRRRRRRKQKGRGAKLDKTRKVLRATKKVVGKIMQVGIKKLKKELGNRA